MSTFADFKARALQLTNSTSQTNLVPNSVSLSDGTNSLTMTATTLSTTGTLAISNVALTNATAETQASTDSSTKLATTAFVQTAVSSVGTGSGTGGANLSSYATNVSVTNALGSYATNTSVTSALGSYPTNTSVNTALGNYATNASVNTALGSYATNASATSALNLKAPIASPQFSGTVTFASGGNISGYAPLSGATFTGAVSLPEGSTGFTVVSNTDTSTKLATTEFVQAAVSRVGSGGGSGGTVNLDSYATNVSVNNALESYATNVSVNASLALKANSSSPTFTGTVNLPTGTTIGTVTAATQDYVTSRGFITDISLTPYVLKASPAFTGAVTLPDGSTALTKTAGTNNTTVATTQYVDREGFTTAAGANTFTSTNTFTTGIKTGSIQSLTDDGAIGMGTFQTSGQIYIGTLGNRTGNINIGYEMSGGEIKLADNIPVGSTTSIKAGTTNKGTNFYRGATVNICDDGGNVNLGNSGSIISLNGNSSTLTQTAATNNTTIATTEYVTRAAALKANMANPQFSGTVTFAAGGNISGYATTTQLDSKAPKADPTFTGTVKTDTLQSTTTLKINENNNISTDINSGANGPQTVTIGTMGQTTQYLRGTNIYINEAGTGNTTIGNSTGTTNFSGTVKVNSITTNTSTTPLFIGNEERPFGGSILIGSGGIKGNSGTDTTGIAIGAGAGNNAFGYIALGSKDLGYTYIRSDTIKINDFSNGGNTEIGNSSKTVTLYGTVNAPLPTAGANVVNVSYLNTALGNYTTTTILNTSLNLKAPIASPTFTGTVTFAAGGNISGYATTTQLDSKANISSPQFTGTMKVNNIASVNNGDSFEIGSGVRGNGANINIGSGGLTGISSNKTGINIGTGTNNDYGQITLGNNTLGEIIINSKNINITSASGTTFVGPVNVPLPTVGANVVNVSHLTTTLGSYATTAALALKENSSNKVGSIVESDAPSTLKYPSVKAVWDFVLEEISYNASDFNVSLNLMAPKFNPTFTGNVSLPATTNIGGSALVTATSLNSSLTSYATNTSVINALGSYVTNASLNTSLGSYATNASLNLKANIANPTFTGTVILPDTVNSATTGTQTLYGNKASGLLNIATLSSGNISLGSFTSITEMGIAQVNNYIYIFCPIFKCIKWFKS